MTYIKSFQVLPIFHWLVIYDLSNSWNDVTYIFLSFLNTYGSHIKYIHHSYFYTHQFSLVAHPFPSLAPYPHGDTKPLVFSFPYDNISDISESIHPHFIFGKVIYQFGRKICDPHHHFAAIQETDYVVFSTLWEGVCKDLFLFSNCVFI